MKRVTEREREMWWKEKNWGQMKKDERKKGENGEGIKKTLWRGNK